ncbi:ER membrane protein complex subunit 1 [Anthonomus grandis grandis]|uniref:ER membrane protein complex subunit 1 n=1 Tax=Anthonomus grandis grandis TaxID=2921223 RepID=UPI002165F330|nr:ER membrane protein complex subunit 1 [Anthonomus grandis grandis]
MANFRSIYKIQVFLTILVHLTVALYEDQVGKFDWKRSFVGKVKYVSIEAKRIIVATEENVLASLNLNSGEIQWRQVLEDPTRHQIEYLRVEKDILTVSGAKNTWLVRTWEIHTGTLLNEWTITGDRTVKSAFTVDKDKLYHIVPLLGSQVEITSYTLKGVRSELRKVPAPWTKDVKECVTANNYFVCTTNEHLHYLNLLEQDGEFRVKPLQEIVEGVARNVVLVPFDGATPAVLVVHNNVAKLVLFHDQIVIKGYTLLPNAVTLVEQGKDVIYQLEANSNKEKLIKVKSKDFHTGEDQHSVDLDYPLGLGAPIILGAKSVGAETHLLLSTTDNALLLVRLPEGKILWTREEALGSIVAAEFLELPVSELDASIEHEFDGEQDVLSMFLHRVSTQFNQLYGVFFGNQLLVNNGLVRDEFGLHKFIIVATRAGKLFAIDTISGSIAWTYRLPNVQPFLGLNGEESVLLLVQRGAQYAPLPAQCSLVAQDSVSGKGVLFQFDPISGFSSEGVQRLNFRVTQGVLLPHPDKNYLKPLVLLSDSGAKVYPPEAQVPPRTFLYTVDQKTSSLHGFVLDNGSDLTPLWEVRLLPSKITGVAMKPASERVHSQGKVLYDRSVYYKYVNPNILAVATVTPDPIHRSVVTIFLIDGVTGFITYSASHKRARGPVLLVHSENWLVYSFTNDRFRRTEVAAVELYEGHTQTNSSVFSSYAVSQLPLVQTQSYILPVVPVKMTVTLTERGITNKFLLMALSNGAVMEIPWLLLQPRFPGMPCGPEESCIPYMPEIPVPPEAVINYNQTLERVRGIEVGPAKLESTCHVLVHGLDLFYTRVAPSKTFDLLKEDFDYRLIVLVLSGLVVASFVTKYLAGKKMLKQAWK